MNTFLRKVADLAAHAGSSLERRFPGLPENVNPADGREPLELYRIVLEQVASSWTVSRTGRHFGANRVILILWARDSLHEVSLQAAFGESRRFEEDLRNRLKAARCSFPPDLRVSSEITSDKATLDGREYAVRYSLEKMANRRFWLDVWTGTARCEIPMGPLPLVINVGRLAEVRDRNGRFVRANQIVVPENAVSRLHGHFLWDPESGECSFIQDEVANRTDVSRGNEVFRVSTVGDPFTLASGDELHIGTARIVLSAGVFEPTQRLPSRNLGEDSPPFAKLTDSTL